MLSVILATENLYKAKNEFINAGWSLVFETPEDSDDRLAIVRLGDAQVMLGIDSPEFLPEESREHKGAGVDIYLTLPDGTSIDSVYEKHLKAGLVKDPLETKPWGVRAFHARICGYSFLIAREE